MKSISVVIAFFLMISCSPNFQKNYTVSKNERNYRMLISSLDNNNDSISINWMVSYQIENKTNRGIKFDWIRKRPEYLVQTEYMLSCDSLKRFTELINKSTSREIIIYCTKTVSRRDFPISIVNEEDDLITFGDYHRNITKIPQEQIKFRESKYFQNILKEIENDSIAIVFRDTVSDDYFEFNGVIKDSVLKYSKWK
ncbi:MAG: hypothetical protein IM568_12350 [Flavobacterium sp.]|nr:hypothetical protein [Flavobacterium sp.]